ncbi:hypothetical protein EDB80DRAFT_680188 [Ilyonectria destructans]|nr:hypothetical protein EDB80DRAFT_680188 [Ilyonectria destructans]
MPVAVFFLVVSPRREDRAGRRPSSPWTGMAMETDLSFPESTDGEQYGPLSFPFRERLDGKRQTPAACESVGILHRYKPRSLPFRVPMDGEQNGLLSSSLRESTDGEQYGPLSSPVNRTKHFLAPPRRTSSRWRLKHQTQSEIAPAKLAGCGRHNIVDVHLIPPAMGIMSRQHSEWTGSPRRPAIHGTSQPPRFSSCKELRSGRKDFYCRGGILFHRLPHTPTICLSPIMASGANQPWRSVAPHVASHQGRMVL